MKEWKVKASIKNIYIFWLRSFAVIRIMVHQRNQWIHDQSGFASSFDAPSSRQILHYWSASPQRNAAFVITAAL